MLQRLGLYKRITVIGWVTAWCEIFKFRPLTGWKHRAGSPGHNEWIHESVCQVAECPVYQRNLAIRVLHTSNSFSSVLSSKLGHIPFCPIQNIICIYSKNKRSLPKESHTSIHTHTNDFFFFQNFIRFFFLHFYSFFLPTTRFSSDSPTFFSYSLNQLCRFFRIYPLVWFSLF